ncbi:MAG: gfo/Idh/MocA family oxidoreductase [Candidatus Gracilibacteria bacterium]
MIVGYGSIGKRHDEVLSSFGYDIDIVSKQILNDRVVYKNLEDIQTLDEYDYFVISSETNKHYAQLKYLESKISNKIIFCEKPLYESYKSLDIKNNEIYVGYVLRFHSLLEKLKIFLANDTILSINVNCGQYLPTWRSNRDYRDSYSAKKDTGGGVLLDLSHEIDYLQWLCGKINDIKSYQVKISDLEIDSDDFTTFIGKTINGVVVNLSVDYISKITYRKIILHTLKYTYDLNFINNKLLRKDKKGFEELFVSDDLERNSMFEKMHKSILSNKINACTYDEALDVMKTITTIQGQNKGVMFYVLSVLEVEVKVLKTKI